MIRALMLLLTAGLLVQATWAQRFRAPSSSLPEDRTKSGSLMLRAFAPVTVAARSSVVRFEINGEEAALGTIIDRSGLVLTKASQLPQERFVCKLATGERVEAHLLATDEKNDLALVKISALGLKPIEWSFATVAVGQWVVTPGVEAAPEAVGIVSVPTRKIPPKQALIGVQLDLTASEARVTGLLPGMGAEKAGLKPGDVILAVNDAVVTNREQLIAQVSNFRQGQTIQLRVRRQSSEVRASVELMARTQDGHGRGSNRQERMNRLGSELSTRAEDFRLAIQHDTVLQAWQCGGPLLNLDGKAVGINIARAGRVASYALPAALLEDAIEELKDKVDLPVLDEPVSNTSLLENPRSEIRAPKPHD